MQNLKNFIMALHSKLIIHNILMRFERCFSHIQRDKVYTNKTFIKYSYHKNPSIKYET